MIGPAEVGILFVGTFVILIVALVWMAYLSNGRITGEAPQRSDDLIENLATYLATEGWKQEHRVRDLLIMQRGPSGCLALLLLVVFLPLGLVYLLTDWGKARVALSVRPGSNVATEFQIDWRGAAIRQELRSFLGAPQ